MKFKVKITLQVRQTFTYEIDERNQRRAEDVACDRAVDEFRISTAIANDPDDVYDIETEQLTEDCEECGVEYPLGVAYIPGHSDETAPRAWEEDQDFCAKCGAEIEAKEKAEEAEKAGKS